MIRLYIPAGVSLMILDKQTILWPKPGVVITISDPAGKIRKEFLELSR